MKGSTQPLSPVSWRSSVSPWSPVFFCPSGKFKKFENGTWHVVPPEDQLKMTKLDGQVWLALLNLLLSPECQHKYHFDGFNTSQLLKVGFLEDSGVRAAVHCLGLL